MVAFAIESALLDRLHAIVALGIGAVALPVRSIATMAVVSDVAIRPARTVRQQAPWLIGIIADDHPCAVIDLPMLAGRPAAARSIIRLRPIQGRHVALRAGVAHAVVPIAADAITPTAIGSVRERPGLVIGSVFMDVGSRADRQCVSVLDPEMLFGDDELEMISALLAAELAGGRL